VTATTGPTTADPQAWWIVDSLRHGGHLPSEVLAFASYLGDQDDVTQVERDLAVRVISPDLGPRRGRGLLARLLGR
jgi:hypothetical protein